MHGHDLPFHHIWIGDEAVDGNRRRERRKKGEKCLERCSAGESRKVFLSDMPPRSRQDRPDACRFRFVSGKADHQLLDSASTNDTDYARNSPRNALTSIIQWVRVRRLTGAT